MAYINLSDLFKGICDAIRAKKGTTGTINHQNIPSEIASIGTNGFKFKQIQVVAQNPVNDVFTFTLDDFNPSQDYIKCIFGEISTEESVNLGDIGTYFLNFHGHGDENSINPSPTVDEPHQLDWVLATVDGSLHIRNRGNDIINIFYEGSGQFRIYYSINSTIGYYFDMGRTYTLYVVYGH